MLIKVCGMKFPENMLNVAAAEPDMLGFIFYDGTQRNMADYLSPDDLKKLSPKIIKTGVFVNETADQIIRTVEKYGLNAVQLHGDESPELCKTISRTGFPVFKAFRVSDDFSFESTEAYSLSCRFFIFDADGKSYGGNGTQFNWEKLKSYDGQTPFLLSGGIKPGDEENLKKVKHPHLAGFDINSKFEIGPGLKNVESVKNFITTLRSLS